MSKSIAMMCFRNTILEDLHGEIGPVRNTTDFSDVVVIDANGQRLLLTEVSRIGTEEMPDLIRHVVNCLYTFQTKAHDRDFVAMIGRSLAEEWMWDEPEMDEIILSAIESPAGRRRGMSIRVYIAVTACFRTLRHCRTRHCSVMVG